MQAERRPIYLAGREISEHQPPFVIAEIGINHGGDIAVAKEMVRLAALSGAECVKHQTHFLEDEMTEEAKSIFPPNADFSIWEVMQKNALSPDEEIELMNQKGTVLFNSGANCCISNDRTDCAEPDSEY